MKDRIFLVAPYCPPGDHQLVNLGAAKKIEMVGRLLSRICSPIVLVNSAHNPTEFAGSKVQRKRIGGVPVIEVTPFTVPSRPIGKLFNLFTAIMLGRRKSNRNAIIWIYNGYAFESLFALFCRNRRALIVEIEDLPFSRRRGGVELKNYIDRALLRQVTLRADVITFVNEVVAKKIWSKSAKRILLPSIISESVRGMQGKEPFSSDAYTVGYFGGLSSEKGVELLLSAIPILPRSWKMIIAGAGPLASMCRELSVQYKSRVNFRGQVSEEEVYTFMCECDVLVNPHKSIEVMNAGVFPFKVFEYLATGRLVFTTALPESGIDIASAVVHLDGSVNQFVRALRRADDTYSRKKSSVKQVAARIIEEYSEFAVSAKILGALGLSYCTVDQLD